MGAFNPGVVAGDFDPVNQSAFVVEHKAFSDLIISLVQPCPCHVRAHWALHSSVQVSIMLKCHYFVNIIYDIQKGHVLRTEFRCSQCHRIRTWASSRVFGAHYLINQKLVVLLHITEYNFDLFSYM